MGKLNHDISKKFMTIDIACQHGLSGHLGGRGETLHKCEKWAYMYLILNSLALAQLHLELQFISKSIRMYN